LKKEYAYVLKNNLLNQSVLIRSKSKSHYSEKPDVRGLQSDEMKLLVDEIEILT
jgi:hypothetical protein